MQKWAFHVPIAAVQAAGEENALDQSVDRVSTPKNHRISLYIAFTYILVQLGAYPNDLQGSQAQKYGWFGPMAISDEMVANAQARHQHDATWGGINGVGDL